MILVTEPFPAMHIMYLFLWKRKAGRKKPEQTSRIPHGDFEWNLQLQKPIE